MKEPWMECVYFNKKNVMNRKNILVLQTINFNI